MAVKTNVMMLTEVKALWDEEFKNMTKGFVKAEHIALVEESLELKGKDELYLRNMRDTAVMFFNSVTTSVIEDENIDAYYRYSDCMSAVTHIIDMKLSEIGCEV